MTDAEILAQLRLLLDDLCARHGRAPGPLAADLRWAAMKVQPGRRRKHAERNWRWWMLVGLGETVKEIAIAEGENPATVRQGISRHRRRQNKKA